jgi:hypothetical protein
VVLCKGKHGGRHRDLWVKGAALVVPQFDQLLDAMVPHFQMNNMSVEEGYDFFKKTEYAELNLKLERHLNKQGSDKGTWMYVWILSLSHFVIYVIYIRNVFMQTAHFVCILGLFCEAVFYQDYTHVYTYCFEDLGGRQKPLRTLEIGRLSMYVLVCDWFLIYLLFNYLSIYIKWMYICATDPGMGTNNSDLVSTMGRRGIPGASLRAFRDYLPTSSIFGADIDSDIMFSEERIRTTFVDGYNLTSYDDLYESFGSQPFDLIIDGELISIVNERFCGVLWMNAIITFT